MKNENSLHIFFLKTGEDSATITEEKIYVFVMHFSVKNENYGLLDITVVFSHLFSWRTGESWARSKQITGYKERLNWKQEIIRFG